MAQPRPARPAGGARLKPESAGACTVGEQQHRRRDARCRSREALAWVARVSTRRDGDAPLTEREQLIARPDPEGDPRAARLPGRRRAGLPDARPRGGDALRRRGAAHPAGDADRLQPDGRALHPGRAEHRPAPARQRAPDPHAGAAARPGQHADRGRARRGDDARGRLDRRHRAGRGRARRRRRRRRARSTTSWPNPESLTGQYPERRRSDRRCPRSGAQGNGKWLRDRGRAREQPARTSTSRFPLGKFVCVTGVSGSGKSTLITDILYQRAGAAAATAPRERPGAHDAHRRAWSTSTRSSTSTSRRSGARRAPTRRPTPALFTPIRELFAQVPEARAARLQAGALLASTSRAGAARPARATASSRSRCSSCPTSTCRARSARASATTARRWRSTTRARHRRRAGHDRRRGAGRSSRTSRRSRNKLQTLNEVGLGYIQLGPAGDARSPAARRSASSWRPSCRAARPARTLYILDEPTTGLHFADIERLLRRAAAAGRRRQHGLVIEHNLDVIKTADWIIDLGPEGGDAAARSSPRARPKRSPTTPASFTGQFLRHVLRQREEIAAD